MVLLCDGRMVCGCADPVRQARARRRAHRRRSSAIWTGERAAALRRDLNAGGSKFCGDCPLKLPLTKDEAPPQRAARRRRRCRRGCTSSAPRPATSPAPRPAARRRPASPGRARPACSTSTCSRASSTKPGRRSARIDFFNYGEAFLHKRAVEMCEYIKSTLPAHLSLHEHQRPRVHRGRGAAAGALGHRRGHLLDRRRDAGELRQVPAARRLRQGDPQPARRRRREAARRARRAVHQLALHPVHAQRQRRGDGARARDGGRHRRRSAVLGADRPSRGHVLAPLRAGERRSSRRSATRSGTTTTSATPSPARRPRAEIDVRGPLPGAAGHRARADARSRSRRRVAQPLDARRSPRRPATAAGSCGSAPSCAQPDGALINRDYERAWLPATLAAGRRRPRSPITITAPGRARTLRAEVRSGQRGNRLVRGVRIADDDEDAGGDLKARSTG